MKYATIRVWGLALALAARAGGQCTEAIQDPPTPVTNGRFGRTLAFDGATLVVGSRTDGVTVYAVGPQGPGTPTELIPSQTGGLSMFGFSVALDGDRMLIGDPSVNGSSGAAFVFERVAGVWSETALLVTPLTVQLDRLGSTVALDGDTAVAAAPDAFPASLVVVFEKSAGAWQEVAAFSPPYGLGTSSSLPYESFGRGLAVQGDFVFVGAPFANHGLDDTGAIYRYRRQPSGWNLEEVMHFTPLAAGDRAGAAIDVEGDRLLVAGSQTNARVFARSGSAWNEVATLAVPFFGPVSVALDGPHAALGSLNFNPNPTTGTNTGAAAIFEEVPGGWNLMHTYVPENGQSGAGYGAAVGLAAGRLAVGAYWFDVTGSFTRDGRVYLENVASHVGTFCTCATAAPCGAGTRNLAGGCANTAGAGATLLACGTTSVSAGDLSLRTWGLPSFQFGIVYMGTPAPQLPLGGGLACLSGPLYAFPIHLASASGAVVTPQIIQASAGFPPAGQIAVGSTWSFQSWYRDPSATCGAGGNLTNALEIRFVP